MTFSSPSYARTVFWLRWKLWRRSWQRQGPLLRAIGVLGTILAIPLCALSFLISIGLGIVLLPSASPGIVVLVWAVLCSFFVYMRIMGLWISLQQDDGLAVDRLLHLPVPFNVVFCINFMLAQLSFGNLLFLPAFIGLAIASAIVLSPGNLILIPAVLVFALCLSAVLHQFHSWLVLSMVNKRKRMVWAYLLFIGVVFLAQVPNLYLVLSDKSTDTTPASTQTELIVADIVAEHVHEREEILVQSTADVTPHWSRGWVLSGSSHDPKLPWWTIAAMICLIGITALSLQRSHRSTLARYRDGHDITKRTVKAAVARQDSKASRNLTSPILVVMDVTLKSWIRSAYGKMVLLSPLVLIMLVPIVLLRYPQLFDPRSLPLVLIGAIVFIGAPVTLVCNLFAFDRLGFRLYLFAGMDLRYVLLGKLLALLLVFGVMGFVVIAMAVGLSSIALAHLLGTVFQASLLFVGFCVIGIVWSARYPYAVSFTSMKAHGGLAAGSAFLVFLCFTALVIWLAWNVNAIDAKFDAANIGFPFYLTISMIEFLVVLAAAGFLLKPLARFVARRSNHILEAVAVEN